LNSVTFKDVVRERTGRELRILMIVQNDIPFVF